MKRTIFYTIALCTLISLCSNSCQNDQPQQVEMGIYLDENSIFEEIKKDYPDIDRNDVCIDKSKYFKTLFIVGFFAHDRGCGDEYYYYDGNKISLNEELIKQILVDNGFKDNKTKVVEQYHLEIINHNNSCLYTVPSNFDTLNHTFEKPKTWIEKDLIISTSWVQLPGGMRPEDVFEKSILVFKNDGTIESHKRVEQFTVAFK